MTGPSGARSRFANTKSRVPDARRSARRHSSFVTSDSPDTICAIATAPGTGGIAVIRVSGNGTFPILDLFFADPGPSRQRSRTVRLSWFTSSDREPIDQVMVTVFRAPRSYTGEDMAEISCHGGTVAADAILNLLVRAGCRVAEPGEFTRRAVLAGKMTLSQAEAVADMAEARTDTAFRGALARYRGELSHLTAGTADDIRGLLAEVEYRLGFDEHEATAVIPKSRAHRIATKLSRLIESAADSRYLIEGANVAIIGRPNAGKSSLFNRLVEGERAITSPMPGTTRDRVDATVTLGGVPVRFVDTAGLTVRTATHLSRLALAQTGKAVEQADIIIALFDGSRPVGPSDRTVAAAASGRQAIYVLNKSDLARRFEPESLHTCPAGLISVSCRTGAGIARVRTRLARILHAGPAPRLVVNRRQLEALSGCRDALVRADTAPTLETAALEIRSAVDMLSQVDAPATSTDVLDRVFARFCVGK
jgi:tRNA modification GTPase